MVLNNLAVPELLENEIGESVNSRTASLPLFKELGPPDLVHLSKTVTKTARVHGTYHYVTGVDTSSSSAVAAYLNTLTFSLGEQQIWFGKHAGWKIHTGIYCCYNIFSRVDVRVLVKIPGGVEAYIVDERGDKHPTTDQIWSETYLSAMIRCLLFADDETYSFISYWSRLNPLSSPPSQTVRFLEAFEKVFFQGPSIGCVSEVQTPTLVNNYLVDGFLKFIQVSGLYEPAIEILERLSEIDPEVNSLLAKVLLLSNEEVKAVRVLHDSIVQNPRDSNILQVQADYCLKKDKLDWALDSAIRAVNASPSEFLPWAELVRIYTKMGDYEQALLTLNSCPMSTAKEPDLPKTPSPAKGHFPLPSDGVLDEVWSVNEHDENNAADPGLLKLPAPTLRSTFAKAYELLTEIVSNIGWDALLKYRSKVFVMEEEYRKDKKVKHDRKLSVISKASTKSQPTNGPSTSEEANGTMTNGNAATSEKDEDKETEEDEEKIKSKRLCERWLDNLFMVLYEDLRVYTVWRAEYVHYQSQQLPYKKTALEWELLGMVALRLRHKDEAADAFFHSLNAKFSHRVLSKVLDYYLDKDDEISSAKSKNSTNFPKVLDQDGTPIKAHSVAELTNRIRSLALDVIVKLTAWNHRWYNEFSPKLNLALRRLIIEDGAMLVRSMVEAKYKPQGVVELIERDCKILKAYGAIGSDS